MVSKDPEHAKMLAEAGDSKKRVAELPMSQYSQEAEILADLVDAVNGLRRDFIMANSKKGAKRPEIPPYPRPRTMLKEARRELRREKHEALVARVLPHKRRD